MKYLWSLIEKQDWKKGKKYRIIVLITAVLFAVIGFAVWGIVRNWALSTWDCMICFIGYPVIFSFVFVFFYSSRHDFT